MVSAPTIINVSPCWDHGNTSHTDEFINRKKIFLGQKIGTDERMIEGNEWKKMIWDVKNTTQEILGLHISNLFLWE